MGRHFRVVLAAALLTTTAGVAAHAQGPAATATTPPFPASAPMPTNNPEAIANVREAKQYNAVMRSNPAFRQRRTQIECGPITDPQLHESCVQSFQAYK